MRQPLHTPGRAVLALLVVLLLGEAAPAWAQAGFAFRNDLNIPVVVQGASVVNGMIRRGLPLGIPPGRTGYDANLPLGNRQITIVDANQPNRVLARYTLPFVGLNQLFSIRVNPNGPVPPAVLNPE